MLDDKAPRSKLGPPSRGSSFYIENLLGTTCREERLETPSVKVTTVHSPVVCAGLETRRLADSEALRWSGKSPNTAYGTSRSECISRYLYVYVSKSAGRHHCSYLSVGSGFKGLTRDSKTIQDLENHY